MEKIDLFRVYNDNDDIAAVSKIISRGHSWANGPEIMQFEEILANYFGVKEAIVFNSGTSAQHVLLLSHGITSGEVIVPSFTFISTVNTVEISGARPVFADIEDSTFGLDPEDVNNNVGPYTKAIIPVHYAGGVCKGIDAIKEIAEDNDILLIEDAAESMGGTIDGLKAGALGDSSILSFCQNKIITTGEGGAILTDDVELANRARLLRSHGRKEEVGEDYFTTGRNMDYIIPGYNFRMPTINAAIGISQMRKIEWILESRRCSANILNEGLRTLNGIKPIFYPDNISSVYQMYPIIVDSKILRDGLKDHLSKKGIATKVYFNPVHFERFYKDKYPDVELYRTEEISGKILSLPFYPNMSCEILNTIVESIRDYL